MIRRPPRSTQSRSSAASDVYKRQVMLALACLKNLPLYNTRTHQGEWLFTQAQRTGIFELNGKTYGLMGMGRTARAVAERLVPFGVKLLYYDIIRFSAEDEKNTMPLMPLWRRF